MACATGLPTAQQAVRALADRLSGREPRPLHFRYFNQCISLGRRDGLIQFVNADDSPRAAVLPKRPRPCTRRPSFAARSSSGATRPVTGRPP